MDACSGREHKLGKRIPVFDAVSYTHLDVYKRQDMQTVKDGISVPLNNPRKSVRLGKPGHLPPGWGTAEIKYGSLEQIPCCGRLGK